VLAGADPAAADTHFSALVRYGPDRVDIYPQRNDPRLNASQVLCYPNPFNGTTRIEFTLPSTQRVALRLYNVLGREVAVLMDEIRTAGRHEMTFDASGLPSGVYLCRLEAGGKAETRKIVLLK